MRTCAISSLALSLCGIFLLASVTVIPFLFPESNVSGEEYAALRGNVAVVIVAFSLILGWLARCSWAGRLGILLSAFFFCAYLLITMLYLHDIMNTGGRTHWWPYDWGDVGFLNFPGIITGSNS